MITTAGRFWSRRRQAPGALATTTLLVMARRSSANRPTIHTDNMPHQVDEEDLAEVWVLVNELTGEATVIDSYRSL